jgi:hypothetical protein
VNNQELLEEIKMAYRVHRLRPIRGFWFIHRKRYDFACPMLALALSRGIVDRADPDRLEKDATAVCEWASSVFGNLWLQGFFDGFDRQTEKDNASEYLKGYSLGTALANDILPGELPLGL